MRPRWGQDDECEDCSEQSVFGDGGNPQAGGPGHDIVGFRGDGHDSSDLFDFWFAENILRQEDKNCRSMAKAATSLYSMEK